MLRIDWDLKDYSRSSTSLFGAWGRLGVDQIKPDLRDISFMRSMDPINLDHLSRKKNFPM